MPFPQVRQERLQKSASSRVVKKSQDGVSVQVYVTFSVNRKAKRREKSPKSVKVPSYFAEACSSREQAHISPELRRANHNVRLKTLLRACVIEQRHTNVAYVKARCQALSLSPDKQMDWHNVIVATYVLIFPLLCPVKTIITQITIHWWEGTSLSRMVTTSVCTSLGQLPS